MADNKNNTLSPETEAIVDRLVAEGKLLRNTGSNSIKSVKETLLDKFAPAFEAISVNTEQTAKALGTMETYFTGNTEKLDGLQEEISKMNDTDKAALEAKLKKDREDAVKAKENAREGGMIDGFKDIVKNLKTGFNGMKSKLSDIASPGNLLKIGKWALLLPIIGGLVKGTIEGFMPVFSSFIKFVGEHPWATLGTALVAFAGIKWATMYASMMMAAKVMGVKNTGGGPMVMGGPDGPDGKDGKKSKNPLKGLRGKIAGLLRGGVGKGLALSVVASGGLLLLGNSGDEDDVDLEAEMEAINRDVSKKEQAAKDEMLLKYENERRGLGTIITSTLTGAAVGSIGMLPGAIFGAVTGFFTGVGQVAYEKFNDIKHDLDELPNALEEELRNEEYNQFNRNQRGRSTGKKTDAEIEDLKLKTDEKIQAIRDGLREQIFGKDGQGGIQGDLESMQALLEEGPNAELTKTGRRGRKVKVAAYEFGGKKYTEEEYKKLVEDQERERVLREKQLKATERILELRNVEAEKIEAVNESTEKLALAEDDAAEQAKKINPQTSDRERKQNVAAGGFALNITNNYYNKGGDTVVNQKSDNRVASNKNTGIVMGGPGGGVTGGWLPNGA